MAFATREKTIVNPRRNPEPVKNKLVIVNKGKSYMAKGGGSGRVISGYGSTVMNGRKSFGRKSKSKAAHRPRSRRNVGEIVSFALNPGSARRKGKMAARKRKKKGWSGHHTKAKGRTNPATYRAKSKHNYGRRRRRGNPGGVGMTDLLMEGVFATAGAVGAKLLTQMVLGANNTGIIGYVGNAASGLALGLAAGMINATRKYAKDIYIGTVVAIVIRAVSDYTSYGSALALSGMGDYQVANFVTPQRYVDGLNTAQIQVPAGWGAPAPLVVASSSVPASHGGSAGLSGCYDGGGMYDIN